MDECLGGSMNREEVQKILSIIDITFPNFNPGNITLLVNVWYTVMVDYTYKDIENALFTYISTNKTGFAPTPGQLIGEIVELKMPKQMSEIEAWGIVYKAICNSTYNSISEFNKLPNTIQRAIGSPDNLREMASMDIDTVKSVEQSHFIKCYRGEIEKERDIAAIPQRIKEEYQIELRKPLIKEIPCEDKKEGSPKEISKLANSIINELRIEMRK